MPISTSLQGPKCQDPWRRSGFPGWVLRIQHHGGRCSSRTGTCAPSLVSETMQKSAPSHGGENFDQLGTSQKNYEPNKCHHNENTQFLTFKTSNISFIILNKQCILESPLVVFRISFHFSFLHTIEQHVDTHCQIESKKTWSKHIEHISYNFQVPH